MSETIKVTSAGEIQLDEIVLIANTIKNSSAGSIEVDLRAIFVEINLFEDLFSSSLYGNILISDSNNLLDQLSIQGLEGLRIKCRTPGLSDKQQIFKTFGIYSISDQQVNNNDRLQTYRLHFCSLELLSDALSKVLNRPFPSKSDSVRALGHELVAFLFNRFYTREGGDFVPRNLLVSAEGEVSRYDVCNLVLGAAPYDYTECKNYKKYANVKVEAAEQDGSASGGDAGSATGSNKIQFIATNWTPLKTINWVTNRSVPSTKEWGGSFVFYESNKAYHYTSINALIKSGKKSTAPVFVFKYDPSNLKPDGDETSGFVRDIQRDYQRVIKMAVNKNLNVLDNVDMGFFGVHLRTIDPILKRYREHNYAFAEEFEKSEHTIKKDVAIGMFPKAPPKMLGKDETLVDPRRNIVVRYREPYFLYDETQNALTSPPEWMSQRMARLASLANFTLSLWVHGRTDIKVGDVIDFEYPSLRGEDNDSEKYQDKYFNGYFLVTAISHFITQKNHRMTLEVIKDGLEEVADNNKPTYPDIPFEM